MVHLHKQETTLAVVSSRFLEALKGILRRLPGGGGSCNPRGDADPYARLPIVRGWKKLCATLVYMLAKAYEALNV